jgi:hypothetical protein
MVTATQKVCLIVADKPSRSPPPPESQKWSVHLSAPSGLAPSREMVWPIVRRRGLANSLEPDPRVTKGLSDCGRNLGTHGQDRTTQERVLV